MQTILDWAQRWHIPTEALHELVTLYRPDDTDYGATAEAQTSKEVERLSGTYRQRVWRNNSGAATCEKTGRQIRYGLGNTSSRINAVMKSSDYIGYTVLTVSQRHVGHKLAIFTALEMKRPGWKLTPGDKRGKAQGNFLTMVNASGGIGMFITDPGQYVEMLRVWGIIDSGGNPI